MNKLIYNLHPALIIAVDALLVYSLAKEAIEDLKKFIKRKKTFPTPTGSTTTTA